MATRPRWKHFRGCLQQENKGKNKAQNENHSKIQSFRSSFKGSRENVFLARRARDRHVLVVRVLISQKNTPKLIYAKNAKFSSSIFRGESLSTPNQNATEWRWKYVKPSEWYFSHFHFKIGHPRSKFEFLSRLSKWRRKNPLQASCISKTLVQISQALGDCINTWTTLQWVLRDWWREQCGSSADKGRQGEMSVSSDESEV